MSEPSEKPPEPELLSLDDAEQLPPKAPQPPPRQGAKWWVVPVSLLLTAFAVGAVYVIHSVLNTEPHELDWDEFQPEGGGFRVLSPGAPLEVEADLSGRPSVKSGELFRVNRWVWFKDLELSVGWFDLEPDAADWADLDTMAMRERKRLLADHDGDVFREGVVRVGQNEGREVGVNTGEEVWVRRMILDRDRNRLYVLTVGGTAIHENSPAIEKYFNSFALTPKDD